MKKVVTQKVLGYKWVVEGLCDRCEANCDGADILICTECGAALRAAAHDAERRATIAQSGD